MLALVKARQSSHAAGKRLGRAVAIPPQLETPRILDQEGEHSDLQIGSLEPGGCVRRDDLAVACGRRPCAA